MVLHRLESVFDSGNDIVSGRCSIETFYDEDNNELRFVIETSKLRETGDYIPFEMDYEELEAYRSFLNDISYKMNQIRKSQKEKGE